MGQRWRKSTGAFPWGLHLAMSLSCISSVCFLAVVQRTASHTLHAMMGCNCEVVQTFLPLKSKQKSQSWGQVYCPYSEFGDRRPWSRSILVKGDHGLIPQHFQKTSSQRAWLERSEINTEETPAKTKPGKQRGAVAIGVCRRLLDMWAGHLKQELKGRCKLRGFKFGGHLSSQ